MVIERVKILASVLLVWSGSSMVAAAQGALVDYESSAKATQAQEAARWRLAFRPPAPVMMQTVAQLRSVSSAAAGVLAEADSLVARATKAADSDARRDLWHAATLLQGMDWNPSQERVGALTLRMTSVVAGGDGDSVSFDSFYPTTGVGRGHWQLELFKAEPTSSATPQRGERVKLLGQGDLSDPLPRRVPLNLSSVAEGAYLLVATVSVGDQASSQLAQSLYLIRNLDTRYVAIKARLKKVKGHESAKWTAEYPFALAVALRDGTREIVAYDFPRAMARSERIGESLDTGRDDVWQSKGLQARAHALASSGELVPYQLYVPSGWSAGRRWPLVVALHGANLDETNMLGRAQGQMQSLAERSGFIVVAPLGYKLNSWYGSERTVDGGPHLNETPEASLRRHLSEQDVLEVMRLIEDEYKVDPHRRYLTGNSMGGCGTWWIGGHYPKTWAAIAPAAYGGVLPEDVQGLAHVPILAVVGDHDEVGMLPRVRSAVATLQAGGVHPQYIEVAGGTHASAYDSALPRIFEFFRTHAR